MVLERGVVLVLLVVVVTQGRTRTALGHVARRVEWVEVSVRGAMGLVPKFAGFLSSTFVGTEWMGVVVRWEDVRTHLSVD